MSIFCDQTTVEFVAGRGGNGSVHFRREKFVAYGGPDGGDGGNGGSIILVADENINTLADFNTKKQFKAEDGSNGQKSHMFGKEGEEMVLKIPAGTLLKDAKTGEVIADLKKHGQQIVIARGGRGGLGNSHFKSSTHRAPEFAELGEEGEVKNILMELQLVADIGIIGFPSAGKSTLISKISNAKPKIAAYPFTTLIPNLGVVDMRQFDKSEKAAFVIADIPGLIEGAHEGKGLGHEFLRHVSRTELLVHLIDPTRENVVEDYEIINHELKSHDLKLSDKEQIVAINKIDAVDPETIKKDVKALEKKYKKLKGKIFLISAITGENLRDLVFEMYQKIQAFKQEKAKSLEQNQEIDESERKTFRPLQNEKKFEIIFRKTKVEASTQKIRKFFDVKGRRIEQLVKMTDTDNPEGVERVYHFLKKMGITSALQKHGASGGDKIRIADKTFLMR